MRMHALDGLDADHALMFGLVRQHRRPGDVADRVDARHIGLAEAVDDDDAAVGFDAELFKPEIFDIADHADGGNHPVDLDRLRLALAVIDGGDHAVALLFQFVTLVLVRSLMPCFSNAFWANFEISASSTGGSAAAPPPR